MTTDHLRCPLCETPAIPPSAFDKGEPMWCEDDEAECPGCGVPLRANITGDGEREWVEAVTTIPTYEDMEDGR